MIVNFHYLGTSFSCCFVPRDIVQPSTYSLQKPDSYVFGTALKYQLN